MDLSHLDREELEHLAIRLAIVACDGSSKFEMLAAHLDGKGYQEIANIHNEPRTSVRRWIVSAKMKLREAKVPGIDSIDKSPSTQPDTLTAP